MFKKLAGVVIPGWVSYALIGAAIAFALWTAYNHGRNHADLVCEAGKSEAKTVVIEQGKKAHAVRSQNRAIPDGDAAVRLRNQWSRD